MKDFKGTPGPWEVDGVEIRESASHPSERICDMAPGFSREDAYLMAAAPELLEAVSAFLLYVDSEADDTESMLQFADALDKARAAHAKALGESK